MPLAYFKFIVCQRANNKILSFSSSICKGDDIVINKDGQAYVFTYLKINKEAFEQLMEALKRNKKLLGLDIDIRSWRDRYGLGQLRIKNTQVSLLKETLELRLRNPFNGIYEPKDREIINELYEALKQGDEQPETSLDTK